MKPYPAPAIYTSRGDQTAQLFTSNQPSEGEVILAVVLLLVRGAIIIAERAQVRVFKKAGSTRRLGEAAVSYTHLTLPTMAVV